MTSLLNLERFTQPGAPGPTPSDSELTSKPELTAAPEVVEPAIIEEYQYEIVLDRSQSAGIGLLAVVLVAVFSGASYVIGKSATATVSTSAVAVPAPPPPAAAQSPKEQSPRAPAPPVQSRAITTPLFGEAVAGQEYLQVGIIEKGSAATWAEGLRTHGLDAFVAPGPSDGLGMWRVLVRPSPDPQGFQRAKSALDALGVPNFGRVF